MGFDDYHRDFYPRSRMAMVLARTNLGSQSLDLRSEPRFAGYLRDRFESGESNLRRNCGRRILRDRWLHHARAVPPYNPKDYQRMSLLQYSIMQFFMLTMVALPIKMLLRLLFHIKYVWITPWFNV